MRRAIRKHLRDFLAIAFMAVIAIGVAGYILSHERFYLPGWVPFVGTDFYTVKAELSTAQAVAPGQGQSVSVAGVKVGEIGNVNLERGVAVVELDIKPKYAPIYRDATALLRSKTGLKDMYIELDPGNRRAGKMPEGGEVRLADTLPDVNIDEILSSLDGDARAYLAVLLNAGGEAFSDESAAGTAPSETGEGNERASQSATQDLRETFKRFLPTTRDSRRITVLLAKRRHNLRRVVHNFQELTTAVARKDTQLASFVDSSNANFAAIARQDVRLREALGLLPGALGETQKTLRKVSTLAGELGPTLQALRPGARALGPALRATRPFLRGSTPIIKNQLRPFARAAQPAVRNLAPAARDLAVATPRLTSTFKVANVLLNMLAFNPRGSEEGFLFWNSWVSHLGTLVFNIADAEGPIRRTTLFVNCDNLTNAELAAAALPAAGTLLKLTNLPKSSVVCR
ncbi:MAG TPA: MlaD family protein [Thermoleophilaceae bacterium]|nr:MlaD family protein [Thermoleophilaceae bacterium]